ncbi:TniQ family protein [Paracraurococcus lichenis]|uniref:TniQ family protein n=1 Tax=Paracraurococcus lichenis TaxID=3064888 RepID=UPI00351D9E14
MAGLVSHLLVRTQPVGADDEGLPEYLLRVATANGYSDPTWLLGEGRKAACAGPSGLEALARLTGAEPSALAAAAVPPRPLPDDIVNAVHPKLCIACLRASPWLRRLWSIRVVLACPEHCSMLLDACPRCGTRLTWRRRGLGQCTCRHDLLTATQVAALPVLVDLAAVIAGLCAGRCPNDSRLAPVPDATAAAQLVWFVASDIAERHTGWRSFHMAKPGSAEIVSAVSAAAPVLLDWPDGLQAWLRSRAELVANGVGVRATFGPVLHRLMASLRGPEFAFLHAEVRRWLADDWRGGHVKPWSPLYAPPRPGKLLTGVEAAERLGVTPSRVPRLVAAKLLDARTSRAGSRVFHLVPEPAVTALLARSAAALTLEAAAGRLGVTAGQVERLARAGLIRVLRSPPGRPRGVYVEPGALNELEARLDAACGRPRQSGAADCTLADLSERGRAALVPTLHCILVGTLSVARCDVGPGAPGLRRYLAPSACLAAPTGMGVADPCVPVRAAASSLGVSVRMVPRLVKAGCLQAPAARGIGGRLGRRAVTAASVVAFPGLFTTAAGLATVWRTSTREVTRRLSAAGIAPVLPRDPARGLSAVWRRSDCEGA